MAAIFILILLAGAAFSVYLLKQTSGTGIPANARSARTWAIVLGFIPFYGIEIVGQLYFYFKYQNAIASQAQIDQAPSDFGAPKPSQRFADDPGQESGQRQQKNNPFL